MSSSTARKKVLLMGSSGAGKSSMRSIIFSNYVAKDVRRLGATIDIEHSQAKFMGNLALNLWDCGGQDAFTDSYLNTQRSTVFSRVSCLIYVFSVDSRSPQKDTDTYAQIITALKQFSPSALVFALIHKMDLVQIEHRERIYDERCNAISRLSDGLRLETFASSIWDQTLYKAWAGIVHAMIPNLTLIEGFLRTFAKAIEAEEIVLFERSTFLTVTHITNIPNPSPYPSDTKDKKPQSTPPSSLQDQSPRQQQQQQHRGFTANPNTDRHEQISNILKAYKHQLARSLKSTAVQRASVTNDTTPNFSNPTTINPVRPVLPSASPKIDQNTNEYDKPISGPSGYLETIGNFILFKLQSPAFDAFLARFTGETYVLVIVPPGEAHFNCAVLNTMLAKGGFEALGKGAAST